MPVDWKRYPKDWKAISLDIRERDGWRCKWCGTPNGAHHPITGGKVTLTVAHLNHDTTDNRDDNLVALCNRCHIVYDAALHARHARATRTRRRIATAKACGQQFLFTEEVAP